MEIYTKNNCSYTLIKGDCLEEVPKLMESSVDLIAVDPPYGTTQNNWDSPINLEKLWDCFKHVLKPNGTVVITATQPFTSKVVLSNLAMFKYETIWYKSLGSGQLNIKRRPLNIHESILVFQGKNPIYNEQLTKGAPYSIEREGHYSKGNYGLQRHSVKNNDGFRHARSVIHVPNPRLKEGYPTQ